MSLRSDMLQFWSLLLGLQWGTMFTQAADSEAGKCISSTSLPLSEEYYEALQNVEEQCKSDRLEKDQEFGVSLFVRNGSGQMEHGRSIYGDKAKLGESYCDLYSGLHLPDSVPHRFLLNISCLLDSQNELKCSWNTTHIPADAQYSIAGLLCNEAKVLMSWNCIVHHLGNLTGCQGTTTEHQDLSKIIIRVNVSVSGFWYIHTEYFETMWIEKLDSPKITNSSFKDIGGNRCLDIHWEKPVSRVKTTINAKCFLYEIKINDEVTTLKSGSLNYSEQNTDPSRKYTVQMRVNWSKDCSYWSPWSDWSEPIVVGPAVGPQPEYSAWMILVIALGLPMILLVFLLLFCKLQRYGFCSHQFQDLTYELKLFWSKMMASRQCRKNLLRRSVLSV
ncbi:interleukin-5 receptor subunit alpha-like isoform X2 [Clupea harengus]|uniref:Interleukin-5 receptor subunit alpha-like isoform X2 n=1 Tax=Clupea harengus TaxID=7950 RepID=A0A6P8FLB1_CLUHA|nr:interleukin-5 receptor subunit alpha-like isoform X2 [Clupea harengus]